MNAPCRDQAAEFSALEVRALRELRHTVGADDLAETWVALVGTPPEALARVNPAAKCCRTAAQGRREEAAAKKSE
jgi:hypothetical protein